MMSGGDVEVEPFLISRNTLGNGKTTTQNLKDKSQMVVAECGGGCEVGNAEVLVVVDEEATIPK
jgi:hypothetical protein